MESFPFFSSSPAYRPAFSLFLFIDRLFLLQEGLCPAINRNIHLLGMNESSP
jgi:hypothetical protein